MKQEIKVNEAARRAAEKVVDHLSPHRLEWARYYRQQVPVEGEPGKDVVDGLAEIIADEISTTAAAEPEYCTKIHCLWKPRHEGECIPAREVG